MQTTEDIPPPIHLQLINTIKVMKLRIINPIELLHYRIVNTNTLLKDKVNKDFISHPNANNNKAKRNTNILFIGNKYPNNKLVDMIVLTYNMKKLLKI